MSNDKPSDLDVECNVVSEYGQSMASVAIRLLRYKDRMSMARSEDERTFIRKEHAEFLRGVIRTHKIAFAAMIQSPPKEESKMDMGDIMKLIGVAGTIAAAVVSAAPGGPIAMVGAGAAAAAAFAGGLHMKQPGYMSKNQRFGQDSEDPR